MTITVTYKKRKYEWDKNRAMNGLPAWKSDKGNFVHSKRLIAQLNKAREKRKKHMSDWLKYAERKIYC
tara:strand:+ start:320 stop:523 length:204 start_codon:yes stop_codon:yes gene_type:complete